VSGQYYQELQGEGVSPHFRTWKEKENRESLGEGDKGGLQEGLDTLPFGEEGGWNLIHSIQDKAGQIGC